METITLNHVDVKYRCGLLEASRSAILRATTVAAPRSSIPATPLHVQTVFDHVYAALREGILDGTLAHGTRLPQGSLAQDFAASRTPLGEALRRLATEGLLCSRRTGERLSRSLISETDARCGQRERPSSRGQPGLPRILVNLR